LIAELARLGIQANDPCPSRSNHHSKVGLSRLGLKLLVHLGSKLLLEGSHLLLDGCTREE
jgi:hypothetical protein